MDTANPFVRPDALRAGITDAQLRGPRFRSIHTAVYIDASVPPRPEHGVLGALAIHPPTAYASHESAALLLGLPIPIAPDVHVTVLARADRRRRQGIRHHLSRPGSGIVAVRGVRLSEPRQLFVELAASLNLVELVVVGDALVGQRLVTPAGLVAYCASTDRRGGALARRAADFVRAGVESPMESRLRMLLVLAGLPEPLVNQWVCDESGRRVYRFDLSYPAYLVAVEYDGRQRRADLEQWDHDTDRREWVERRGWLLVSVFSRGVYREAEKTIERVRSALVRRGCVEARRSSEEWRRFF